MSACARLELVEIRITLFLAVVIEFTSSKSSPECDILEDVKGSAHTGSLEIHLIAIGILIAGINVSIVESFAGQRR